MLIIIAGVNLSLFGQFSGLGSGTEADPYQITSLTQLEEVNYDLSAHYILMNDITMTGTYDNAVIGPDPDLSFEISSESFTGVLDGNYKQIIDLHIVVNDSYDRIGLFGAIGKCGHVKRLGLEGLSIELNKLCSMYVGGLCGINDGMISNSYTIGNIVSNLSQVRWGYRGGLIGACGPTSQVSSSYSMCNLLGTFDTSGGISGSVIGIVNNCYATGNVYSNNYVGGFCGEFASSVITNCYSIGSVSSATGAGGFSGNLKGDEEVILNSCYYLENTGPDNGFGEPLTSTQITDLSSYYNWAITSDVNKLDEYPWYIPNDGSAMPRLSFEVKSDETEAVELNTEYVYQGRLESSLGSFNETHVFRFSIYVDPDGPDDDNINPIEQYTKYNVTMTEGLFSIPLDLVNGKIADYSKTLYLQVEIKEGEEFKPVGDIQTIRPVPQALFAYNGAFPGEIKAWGGPVRKIPPGWLVCDGKTVSRLVYPQL